MRINKKNIYKKQKRLALTCQELESNQLKSIKTILPPKRVDKICRGEGYQYRKRLITPLVTLLHMIGSAVSRERSFQSAWHNTGQVGCSDILCQARKRLPLRIWQGVDRWIDAEIAKEFDQQNFWRGHRLIGIDGSCVSMSDTPELQKIFGRTESKHGSSRFPVARVMFGFTINTQVTVSHNLGHYRTSEQSLLKDMLKNFHKGDVIICDRHFAGANLYVQYKEAGLEFVTPLHQRQRVDHLKKVKEHAEDDFLVELALTKKHIKENDRLPPQIVVRLIRVETKIRGRQTTLWLVTSLLDAKKYPATEIKDLYKKRWKVETLIEEIKIWLGSDVLRSKTADGIRKELYARIVAGNLIHWLVLKAAKKHNKDPQRISMSAATRLIHCYSLKMSEAPEERISDLYEQLLEKIASCIVPHRPNRLEPRMKRRDSKHYPILHVSRAQWRNDNATA
jgi:hypothetical protein